jgi:hypothetical protein
VGPSNLLSVEISGGAVLPVVPSRVCMVSINPIHPIRTPSNSNSVALVRKRTIPTERPPLSAK